MNKKILVLTGIIIFSLNNVKSQSVYPITSGEFIFSFADVEMNEQDVPVDMRFSLFFHYGQYWHFDVFNNLGFYTGGAIRNVGFITDEDNYKVKRRSYTLGVPFAVKLGSFRDGMFIYGGGEYELLFHYKQKIFTDGNKIKTKEWFSNRTNRFVPSVFAGIQFPKGINVKFKYYLDDFLNPDFKGTDNGQEVDYSDFNKMQLYYISLSKQIRTQKIRKKAVDNEYIVTNY
jgi:hypothetical protein